MVLTMMILSGMLALGTVTLMHVRHGMQASTSDRMHSTALFAAESGLSAGMSFLRDNFNAATNYTAFVSPSNSSPQSPLGIPGNKVEAGELGSLFSADSRLSYEVTILNNADDPTFVGGTDSDSIVILRSVGIGPGGAQVTLEMEVGGSGAATSGRPCPGYAQRGIAEDGAGRNDCLVDVDGAITKRFTPGS